MEAGSTVMGFDLLFQRDLLADNDHDESNCSEEILVSLMNLILYLYRQST